MSNVYGFSPNQLGFGRNTNFPSVHHDRPPAENVTCISKYMAENLAALHAAREAFIKQESCERLRRALNRQTRTYSDTVYSNGERVYYKRKDTDQWHGPAIVLGKDSAQYLLKHGGIYIRVHPCRMQLDQHDPDVMAPVKEPSLGKNTESEPQNDENQLCKDDEIDEDDSNVTEF